MKAEDTVMNIEEVAHIIWECRGTVRDARQEVIQAQAEISFKAGREEGFILAKVTDPVLSSQATHEELNRRAKAFLDDVKKEGIKEVVELCLQAIGDEPEFPGEMPDELWDKLNGNREIALNVMRNSVRLTKQAITERLQAQLKEWDLWKKK